MVRDAALSYADRGWRDRAAEQPSSRLFLQYTGVLHHFEAPHNVSRVQQRPHISHTTLLAQILLQEDYWHKKHWKEQLPG